jgi:hypothetical protein
LIYGTATTTVLRIKLAGPGTNLLGMFTPSPPSAHEVLGFTAPKDSLPLGIVDAEHLRIFLEQLDGDAIVTEEQGKVRITSSVTDKTSSFLFSTTLGTGMQADLGLPATTVESFPPYLELTENSIPVAPSSLGINLGCRVVASETWATNNRTLNSKITSIEGTKLFFSGEILPRGSSSVVVKLNTEEAVQTLVKQLGASSVPISLTKLQQVLAPLVIKPPTAAQLIDVSSTIQSHRKILDRPAVINSLRVVDPGGLLQISQAAMIDPSNDSANTKASLVVDSLEERGLDYATDLLARVNFAELFNLGKSQSSKASNLLANIETIGRNDYPFTTSEEDQPELTSFGNDDEDRVLPPLESSEEGLDG